MKTNSNYYILTSGGVCGGAVGVGESSVGKLSGPGESSAMDKLRPTFSISILS